MGFRAQGLGFRGELLEGLLSMLGLSAELSGFRAEGLGV